ncbi:MAG: Crp/Fnr family transcriptional regulator [Alphaproteobacteria bacterium]|jgi:CRP/FNR family transcriptional regulator, dissimilatory nitrate respiration regulator|nr:Crp/Fnr family transcriptional regulator [Alphaproteobacteria bacterium]
MCAGGIKSEYRERHCQHNGGDYELSHFRNSIRIHRTDSCQIDAGHDMIVIMSGALIELLSFLPSRAHAFAAGNYLFRQSDSVRTLHQIVEGEAHLIRLQANGGRLVLQRARAGSVLAEASLFSEHYHCDAVAVRPTRTQSIDKADMRSALNDRPGFATEWAAYLAHEVQAARLRAEILSLKTVAERLDAWIAANDGGQPAKGDWKTVAAEIGTSAEALYREIAKRREH